MLVKNISHLLKTGYITELVAGVGGNIAESVNMWSQVSHYV
jgi:hypothetical protein